MKPRSTSHYALWLAAVTALTASTAFAGDLIVPDITPLIGKIDFDAGSASYQLRCFKCHNFEKDMPGNGKKGPNLWGVFNNNIAAVPGYDYSKALIAKRGKALWTYIDLNKYIYNPGSYVPGTKHPIVYIGDNQERANLIGWLSTLYDEETLKKRQEAANAAQPPVATPAPAPVPVQYPHQAAPAKPAAR